MVFFFVLYDKLKGCLNIGHDPLGVRPLYWYKENHYDTKKLILSSEMKGIYGLEENIEFYPPGNFSIYYLRTNKLHTYFYNFKYSRIDHSEEEILTNIKEKLTSAVKKRLLSDRPIGCKRMVD